VTSFRGQKVKVNRPINADTENAPYLPKEKTDELQTWNGDGVRSPTSPTCAVTSKVKGHGYNVTLPSEVREAQKSARRVSVPRLTSAPVPM